MIEFLKDAKLPCTFVNIEDKPVIMINARLQNYHHILSDPSEHEANSLL